MPFIVSSFISPIIAPYTNAQLFNYAFSFASFFLFLAVIPLMIASETLPEKLMQDLNIKSYADKALKQALKKEKKSGENNSEEKRKDEVESPEDMKARELAEKYY